MKTSVKLSLCRINNHDIANCRGFDLSVHRRHFRLNAHCHSREKSLFIDGLNYSVSVILPDYLKVRLYYRKTHYTRPKGNTDITNATKEVNGENF